MTACEWITDAAIGPYRGGRWKYRIFDLPAFLGMYLLIGSPRINEWQFWALVFCAAVHSAAARAEGAWESAEGKGPE